MTEGRAQYLLLFSLCLCLVTLEGCQEALPSYKDPRGILSASVSGEYVLHLNDNSMNVYVTVKNGFDESLQAVALLNGSLEISLIRLSTVRKTVALSKAHLIQGPNYNPTTGEIILNPGDSIRLMFKWNWIDDSGLDLRLSVFQYWQDLQCNDPFLNRCLAEEEFFSFQGTMKVVDRIPAVTFGPTQFSVRFVSRYVNPKYCPLIVPWVKPLYGNSRCVPTSFAPIP